MDLKNLISRKTLASNAMQCKYAKLCRGAAYNNAMLPSSVCGYLTLSSSSYNKHEIIDAWGNKLGNGTNRNYPKKLDCCSMYPRSNALVTFFTTAPLTVLCILFVPNKACSNNEDRSIRSRLRCARADQRTRYAESSVLGSFVIRPG